MVSDLLKFGFFCFQIFQVPCLKTGKGKYLNNLDLIIRTLLELNEITKIKTKLFIAFFMHFFQI